MGLVVGDFVVDSRYDFLMYDWPCMYSCCSHLPLGGLNLGKVIVPSTIPDHLLLLDTFHLRNPPDLREGLLVVQSPKMPTYTFITTKHTWLHPS